MMKVIKIILLVIVILAVLIVGGCTALFAIADHQNKNYWKYATPAGEIEKKYTAMGELEVSYSCHYGKRYGCQSFQISRSIQASCIVGLYCGR